MPFQVDYDSMSQFEAMPKDQQDTLWQSLPPEQAKAISDYYPTYQEEKKKRAAQTTNQPNINPPVPSGTTNTPVLQPADIAQVKKTVARMPQYRTTPLGTVNQINVPQRDIPSVGAVLEKALNPSDEQFDQLYAIEHAPQFQDAPDDNAFDWLKKRFAKHHAAGQIMAANVSETNPVNVLARNTVGAGLRVAQENVGRPAASMLLKEQMTRGPIALAQQKFKQSGMDWDSLNEKEQDDLILAQMNPEQKEFYLRHKGSTAAELRPPSKYVTPGTSEMLWRDFLSATGSDKMKLSAAKHKEAEANLTTMEIGGVEIAPLVAKAVELGGELPYYAVGTTGLGQRVAASKMARVLPESASVVTKGGGLEAYKLTPVQALKAEAAYGSQAIPEALEKELGAMQLSPAEKLKWVSAAQRHGAASEFAAQSALVSAKNKEDIGEGAIEGYVAGQILHKAGELLTAHRAAKKVILSSVNAERTAINEAAQEVSKLTKSADPALILPPITWKEFVKSAAESSKRAAEKPLYTKRAGKAPVEYVAGKKVSITPEGFVEKGSPDTDWTFRRWEFDDKGYLHEVRYLSNVDGSTKQVYARRHDQKSLQKYTLDEMSYLFDGSDVEATAAAFEGREGRPLNVEQSKLDLDAKADYKAPEMIYAANPNMTKAEVDAAMSKFAKERSPEVTNESVTRPGKGQKEVSQLLTINKKGDVKATPLIDRAPKTDTLEIPEPKPGDMVHLPDGEPGIVEKTKNGRTTVNIKGGEKVEVPTTETTPADENLLDLNYFLPQYSAKPYKKGRISENLLALKELDIKRFMNARKTNNPAEAKAVLEEMVKAGQLEKEVAGKWKVKESYKPEAPDGPLPDKDYTVYYNVSKDGKGKAGVLRGRDPKKLGNVLIEIGKERVPYGPATAQHAAKAPADVHPSHVWGETKLISIPRDQVRSYVPVLGNANRSQLPQGEYGVSVPMPPDVLIMSASKAQTIATYTRMEGQLNKILAAPAAIKRGLEKLFVHDAYLVPADIRPQAVALTAQPGLMKARTEVLQNALAKRLGGEINPANTALAEIMQKRASRLGRQKLSDQEEAAIKYFAANPQHNAEVQDTVMKAMKQLKQRQQQMVQLGITNIADIEAARAAGLEDEYAMNVYMKWLAARKDFAGFVKNQMPEKWDAAVRHFLDKYPGQSSQQVEQTMLEVLGMDEKRANLLASKEPGGSPEKKLRERLKMANEVSELIGKIDSFSIQMAHSLAASESIINRVATWNTLQKTPYWSPGPRADLGPHMGVPVPNKPIYGAARGGYMHESFRYLLEAPPPHVEAMGWLRTIASVWKFNQVIGGGMTPWVNQVFRNWKGMIVSGGLQSKSDLATFYDAAEMLTSYRDNPITNGGNFYHQLMQNSPGMTGFAGSEISKNKAANRVLDAIRKQRGQHHTLSDLMADIGSNLKGGAEEMGAAYDAIDRLFKLTAAMNNYRRAIAGGMSPDDAMALAVMRNNQSFINFEMVSPATEKMRQSGLSAAAPFVSSHMEDLRINGTIMMRLAKEPELAARLIQWTAAVGGVLALMREQRRANGITDDMARKAKDSPKLATQAFHPLGEVWTEFDSNGNLQIVDPTQFESAAIMFQMHERDNVMAAILRNNLTGAFGEDSIVGTGIDMGFNLATGTVPLSQAIQMIEKPGEQGWMQMFTFIAAHGGLPQAPFKGYKYYQMTQPPDTINEKMYQQPWTSGQFQTKMLGLPLVGPVGTQTAHGRAKEALRSINDMIQQTKSFMKSHPREEWDAAKKAKFDAAKEIINEYKQSKK